MRLLSVLVLLTVGATRGCYAAEESAGQTLYQFNGTVRLLVVLIPLLALFGGIAVTFFVPRGRAWGLILGGMAAIFLVLVVPGIFMDRVTVSSTGISQKTGFWFSPTVKGFDYRSVVQVSIEKHEVRGSRGRRETKTVWVIDHRNGIREELDPGDLWESATPDIVPRLEAHGVRFSSRGGQ